MASIGERLRMAREQAGLSQGQVARLLGMHRPTISEIEAGRRRVTAEELVTFAKTYEASVEWLSGADPVDDGTNDRVRLAARELSKLKPEDLDRVMGLLAKMRTSKEPT